MNRRVIIVHGWGGSPQSDFFPWLRQELERMNYEVVIPAMPDTDNPRIEKWVPHLTQVIGEIKEDDILIGHSIGCQTILRFLESLPEDKRVGKAILVAGFGSYLKGLTRDEKLITQPWIDAPLDLGKVRTKANSFVAIFSDNDPFVPLEENSKLFQEKLGAKILIEHNKGHFNQMPKECPDLLEFCH